MFDPLIDILFFNLYGAAITFIAVLAAIPYGIWQGLKRLKNILGGSSHGDSGTGGGTEGEDDRGAR